ncbi:hypothetical protein KCP74_20180 [Salmonella enterica subsp. enterica]|nr:hypothetical protein KCP74_20180 [Salmonella enterica subsp. enterica]
MARIHRHAVCLMLLYAMPHWSAKMNVSVKGVVTTGEKPKTYHNDEAASDCFAVQPATGGAD